MENGNIRKETCNEICFDQISRIIYHINNNQNYHSMSYITISIGTLKRILLEKNNMIYYQT